jgi:putative DNA primase/helicase
MPTLTKGPQISGEEMFHSLIESVLNDGLNRKLTDSNRKLVKSMQFLKYDSKSKQLDLQLPQGAREPTVALRDRFTDALRETGYEILQFVFVSYREPVQEDEESPYEEPTIDEDGLLHVDFSPRRADSPALVRRKEGITTQRADLLEIEDTWWVWPGYVPQGMITVLAGDPSMGKSTLAIDIVARVTRGTTMHGSKDRTMVGTCIIATAEDSTTKTALPRLIAAGADLTRVHFIHEVEVIEGETRPFCLPRDLTKLRDLIEETGARVAVIDPFNAFLERDTDSYRDQDIRAVLAPIEKIAHETSCAIIIIFHLNKDKSGSTPAIYRVLGSVGIVAAARSALGVMRNNEDSTLFSIKCNIAQHPPAWNYTMESREVTWKEKTVTAPSIHWLGKSIFDPSRGDKANPRRFNDWLAFCKQVMSEGVIPSKEFDGQAKAAHMSLRSFDEYKRALGITSRKERDGSWSLVAPKTWPTTVSELSELRAKAARSKK